jgi:hypothetical protein
MNKKIFSVFIITMLVLGAFAVGTSLAGDPPGEPSVAPIFVEGNPTCESLGYPLGIKVDPPASGVFSVGNGEVTVELYGEDGDDFLYLDWTSTYPIMAVIVKGGPNANLYDYDPVSFGDVGLHSPLKENGDPYAISHFNFCFDVHLEVTKTAETEYTRTWEWDILKTSEVTELTLAFGQTYPVDYLVTVTGDYEDGGWAVSGVITIYNPSEENTAYITSIVDMVEVGIPADVECAGIDDPASIDPPYELGPEETLVCTYSADLPDGVDRNNKVVVMTSGSIGGGKDIKPVVFGDPTDIIDECVDVEDNHYGELGSFCASEEEKTFTFLYTINIGPFECGESEFVNEATFTTNDTQTEGSDSHTVVVYVDCEMGCTLTQGYWKTHSKYGPAPYDPRWANLADGEVDGEDVIFFLSGVSNYEILWTSPRGNAYYILAPQYLAAKLNILGGAFAPEEVEDVMDWAEDFFETYLPSHPFTRPQRQEILQAAELLDAYNNGLIGPGHCSEEGDALASILMFDYESPFGYFEVFLPMSIKR